MQRSRKDSSDSEEYKECEVCPTELACEEDEHNIRRSTRCYGGNFERKEDFADSFVQSDAFVMASVPDGLVVDTKAAPLQVVQMSEEEEM